MSYFDQYAVKVQVLVWLKNLMLKRNGHWWYWWYFIYFIYFIY